MARTEEQLRAAVAAAAALVELEPGLTWADALFAGPPAEGTPAAGAPAFSRPDDPDRRLLAALLAEHPELERHAATLPGRLHVEWLSRILGIPRLPVVPDRVVAHASADPKLAPVVLPAGTLLHGGKDAAGAERRYETLDDLTAHGASLVGVRSFVSGPASPHLGGTVAAAPEWPLAPGTGGPAPHALRISDPVLAFAGGTMTVRISLVGGTASLLQHATWHHRTPDGKEAVAVASGFSGANLQLVMQGGAGMAGEVPWVEARIPAGQPVPVSLQLTRVDVTVTSRTGVVPDSAGYNDGLLDVSKEFHPFGEVARRGDAFYLRSDEAFAKPLATLGVALELMSTDSGVMTEVPWGTGISSYAQVMVQSYLTSLYPVAEETEGPYLAALAGISDLVSGHADPRVDWQRRVDGQWQTFTSTSGALASLSGATIGGDTCSEPTTVAGATGHHIRAFLAEGDFGWQAYQEQIAAFATATVAGDTPVLQTPPVPAVVSRVALSYTTAPVTAASVVAVNGWSRRDMPATGTFAPFALTVSPAGDTGMVAIGLALPEVSLGSSVSLHLEVDSASPCGSSIDPDAHWEHWDGATWQPLVAVDGTRLLRESGILRLVAPLVWPVGCPDVDQPAVGRWLRIVTRAPERLGRIRALAVDAVLAEYRSTAADPASDPTPATPLAAGAIKGTLAPIRGIKKVTNLGSVRGRGPESDPDYRRRASALVRHRGRAISAWDYEQMVAIAFPEVAAVRCLPHTGPDGSRQVGSVGLVVIPDAPEDPAPRPSVSLAGRIADVLAPAMPMHARATILCAAYQPVTVEAHVLLRRGVAALTGRDAVTSALEAWLHPTGVLPPRLGRSLYRSSLEAFLERLALVDTVSAVSMRTASGAAVERVDVDQCRGLFCSSGAHRITVQEQL